MPLAEAAVAAYGGRYIVRGGEMCVLEGNRPVRRAVILEFDSPDLGVGDLDLSKEVALKHASTLGLRRCRAHNFPASLTVACADGASIPATAIADLFALSPAKPRR